jgi:hypothetical protein
VLAIIHPVLSARAEGAAGQLLGMLSKAALEKNAAATPTQNPPSTAR